MSVQPRYSDRSAAANIEKSMEGTGVFVPEIQIRALTPFPIRTIYPAARPGMKHAYFPEGVKEGLEHLSAKAITGGLNLTNGLELFGVAPREAGLNPNDLDDALILGVEYNGKRHPAKPFSLSDLGIHLMPPDTKFETPETVSTIAKH